MEIDLKLLTMALKNLTEDECSSIAFGVPEYLIENIYKPFMRDKPVYYKDLDFNAFDREDINRFSNWLDHLYSVQSSLCNLNESLCCAPPAAGSSRTFF